MSDNWYTNLEREKQRENKREQRRREQQQRQIHNEQALLEQKRRDEMLAAENEKREIERSLRKIAVQLQIERKLKEAITAIGGEIKIDMNIDLTEKVSVSPLMKVRYIEFKLTYTVSRLEVILSKEKGRGPEYGYSGSGQGRNPNGGSPGYRSYIKREASWNYQPPRPIALKRVLDTRSQSIYLSYIRVEAPLTEDSYPSYPAFYLQPKIENPSEMPSSIKIPMNNIASITRSLEEKIYQCLAQIISDRDNAVKWEQDMRNEYPRLPIKS